MNAGRDDRCASSLGASNLGAALNVTSAVGTTAEVHVMPRDGQHFSCRVIYRRYRAKMRKSRLRRYAMEEARLSTSTASESGFDPAPAPDERDRALEVWSK
jgi:hypothetical protein